MEERRYEISFRWDEGIKVSFSQEGDKFVVEMKNVGMYYSNMPIPDGYKRCGEKHVRRISDGSMLTWIPVRMLKSNGFREGDLIHRFGRRPFLREDFTKEKYVQPKGNLGVVIKQSRSIKKYSGFYVSTYFLSEKGSVPGELPITVENYEEAFRLAKRFEERDDFSSHLILGEEYDTIAEWAIEANDLQHEIIESSSSIGNYSDSENAPRGLKPNGSKEEWQVVGVYDFTGNLATLTQEKYNGKSYVLRGGSYDEDGSEYPAACRQTYFEKQPNVGVRVALFMR